MSKPVSQSRVVWMAVGFVVAASVMCLVTNSSGQPSLSETHVNAATARGGNFIIMVTGPIDGENEGLFALDRRNGTLHFLLLDGTAQWRQVGKTNVSEDVGVNWEHEHFT